MFDFLSFFSFLLSFFHLYFIFIISLSIDLNRIPFDLIEGESELVSGFNLERYRRLFICIIYLNIQIYCLL